MDCCCALWRKNHFINDTVFGVSVFTDLAKINAGKNRTLFDRVG
jgi:hypothetical protein